jgi:hypothetical protein
LEERENEIRLLGALYLASFSKGARRQLFDVAMDWLPLREMVERHAKAKV